MIRLILALLVAYAAAAPSLTNATTDGIAFTSERSEHDFVTTAERLRLDIERRGLMIFSEIDHAENARAVGETIEPTLLFIFGDPEVGTQVIKGCAQSTGLDLPLKMLVWQDDKGSVWVSYNKWTKLDMRHEFSHCGRLLDNIENQLQSLAETAADG